VCSSAPSSLDLQVILLLKEDCPLFLNSYAFGIKAVSKEAICDDYTIECTVDGLYLCLLRVDNNIYEERARSLIYQIPVHRPTPFFEIKISDLNQQIKKELDNRWDHKPAIDYILKESVGRIFENIDERYFLLSVKRLLKVRLIP
jgi:hypothetical protein